EPLGVAGEVAPELLSRGQAYGAGLTRYRARDFAAAAEQFALGAHDDPPSALFLERVRQLAQQPPGPGWEPVSAQEEKRGAIAPARNLLDARDAGRGKSGAACPFQFHDSRQGAGIQSAFAPDNLTTFAHFSVSSANSLAKSAGEPGSGVPPSSAIRAFILGSTKAALSSRLSVSTMAAGVPAGAAMPYHALASQPRRKSAPIGAA